MDWIWVVITTTFLTVGFTYLGLRKVFKLGYKKGAEDVLEEWKRHMLSDEWQRLN